MAGINEPASWGQCLSTAVFSSNYLETEEEVINNPGSQPETALPHKTLREGPGPKGHFLLGGWFGAGWGNKIGRKIRRQAACFHYTFLPSSARAISSAQKKKSS